MTFCGYNEPIADGLRTLVEGVIVAIDARCANGTSVDSVIEAELRDLQAINAVLLADTHAPQERRDLLIGINTFAAGLLGLASGRGLSTLQFRAECEANVERFVDLVRDLDRFHQSRLSALGAAAGSQLAIKEAGAWALKEITRA